MKKTITSIKIPQSGDFRVPTPPGCELLSVGFIDQDLYLWAMIDQEGEPGEVRLLVWPENQIIDLHDGLDLMPIGHAVRSSPIVMPGGAKPVSSIHVFQVVKES